MSEAKDADVDRLKFEKWWATDDQSAPNPKEYAWQAWQAAISSQSLSQEAVRDEALEEFPVELMSHSMDDDKRIMARKILKLKRVEKAYCAANDYINALTGTASIPPESLEKIKAAYWEAVREVQ